MTFGIGRRARPSGRPVTPGGLHSHGLAGPWVARFTTPDQARRAMPRSLCECPGTRCFGYYTCRPPRGMIIRELEAAAYFRTGMQDSDIEEVRRRLAELQSEHRDLDDVIGRITGDGPFDQLQVQRLKKRKLLLKDQIAQLESELLPDIIA